MDGGFVTRRVSKLLGRHATADDVEQLAHELLRLSDLAGVPLLRVFYYDAPPFMQACKHPLSGQVVSFDATEVAGRNAALLAALRLKRDFAVRCGRVALDGWRVRGGALRRKATTATMSLRHDQIIPDFKQKEVDLKIGLDIAWISLKQIASDICLVTADSDFVPVMKFARREGVRVHLQTLGQPPINALREHADVVLPDWRPNSQEARR